MAKLVPIAVSLFLSLILRIQGAEIGCNLLPHNRDRSEASPEPVFGISMNASTEFTVGGYPVEVTLTNVNLHPSQVKLFKVFSLQAHDMLDKLHGRWEPLSNTHQTKKCRTGEADTLSNAENMPEQASVKGLWYPEFSETEVIPNKDIDFNAAILLDDGTFWTDIRSSILRARDVHSDPREAEEPVPDTDDETEAGGDEPEVDGTGEDPNAGEDTDVRETAQEDDRDNTDDAHGRREEEEKLIKWREAAEKQIREEDAASEGDWVREEEEERRRQEEEQHSEMVEYERVMAEEERRRQEMIRWEIKDKEEHDRLQAEQTTDKQPPKTEDDDKNQIFPDIEIKDSGAATPVLSVVFTVLPLLLQLV